MNIISIEALVLLYIRNRLEIYIYIYIYESYLLRAGRHDPQS